MRNEYKFEKGKILSGASNSSAQFVDAEMDRDTKDRYEEQDILSVVGGGENLVGNWLVEYQVGYSKSSEAEPNRIDADFAGEELALGYQTSGDIPQLTQSAEAHNLDNFELDEIVLENNNSEDEELSITLDLTRDFVWNNHNGAWKFGFKHRDREKFNDADVTVYDGGFNDAVASQFAASTPDFGIGDFGPGIDRKAMRQFFKANVSGFEINDIDSNMDSYGQSYQSEEQITAAYAMVTLDMGEWLVVAGLRYEDTAFSTKGNRVELIIDDINDEETVTISPWAVEKDYDYLLPSLNVRYTPSENLVGRFAFTQTIARPTFEDSAAFQLIESETTEDDGEIVTERKAEVGNPDLNPYESTNFDLSLAYYPGNIGVLSAGLFYKDIDNFIVLEEVQDNGQWDGFEEVMQHVNGGSASLTGLELAWNKTFDSGLLLGLNTTLVDADDKLPNQSDTVANAMLGFENHKFSARLSASYKSESFQFEDNNTSVFEDAHMQFDLSAKYYISDTINVYFNAINLTDEPLYIYHGSKSYNYQYEEYGRSFELGITFNSL